MWETPPFKVQRKDQSKWKLKRVTTEVGREPQKDGPVETKGKPDLKIGWLKVSNSAEVSEDED